MKRFLLIASLVLVAQPWLSARELTADELKRATDHLQQTSDALFASTAGLSEAQLAFKSAPTRWSIAEVAEHITSTEGFLLGMIKEKVMQAPARTEAADLPEIDAFVLRAIADRTSKAQAPEPLAPTNRFGTPAETLKQFKTNRAQTVAFLTSTKDLREHAIDSPLGKQLDAYQWVLFLSAHADRHTQQINEVKADAHFPKS